MVDRSAVVLASGFSSAFGQDKASLEFSGKSLIRHVVDAVNSIVDEVIVVAGTQEQTEKYAPLLEPSVRFVVHDKAAEGVLGGALAGFAASKEKSSLLLSSDSPLVSVNVVDLLFELCPGKTAVVPRWPDQRIEPLQSVYHTKSALKAGQMALEDGYFDLEALIGNLGGVRYISTLAIQEFDPELKTFFSVNTTLDLKMAETLTKEKPWKVRAKRKR
jgi:molybdopterin-guanine dinucleotide biosynthesis protein A